MFLPFLVGILYAVVSPLSFAMLTSNPVLLNISASGSMTSRLCEQGLHNRPDPMQAQSCKVLHVLRIGDISDTLYLMASPRRQAGHSHRIWPADFNLPANEPVMPVHVLMATYNTLRCTAGKNTHHLFY